MRIVTQAYVALILWAIIIVIVAILNFVKKMSAGGQVFNIVLLLLNAAFSSYAVNCMVVGECRIFSWFYIILVIFFSFGLCAT